jgi:TPR repeat protein
MRNRVAAAAWLVGVVSLGFPLNCRSQSPLGKQNLEAGKRAYRQGDYTAALNQLTPLAQQGNAEAQVALGTMYLKGQGVAKNPSQALKWYTSSAEQGNAEGQFYLGSMYLMGAGVAHDAAQGLKWLGISANQGNSDSQVLLGLVYLQGNGGVARDLVQADMWFHLAASHGDPLAPRQTEATEKQMTPAEITKANALVAAWKPKTSPELGPSKK